MEFKKYNSIENTYQEKVLEQIFIHGFEKETYIVQEKVHGANFSFYTDGEMIKIAKRSDFIHPDEMFYNAQSVAEKHIDKVFKAFEMVKEKFPETKFMIIFGELFGGNYNHPEVTKVKDAIKVQKGIDYGPENDFYAFDIKINGTDYLDVTTVNRIFEETGFFYAKTLFRGSLKAALQYPNEFNSLIPEWLGLPALDTNICEGVIIKPLSPKFFGNGSRVILKNKNEKWTEVAKERSNAKPEVHLSEVGQKVWNTITNYITTNRLYNVLSKEGEFDPTKTGKLIGLFSQDILSDFKKDHPMFLESLEKEEQKHITKSLNNQVVNAIKQEFMTFKEVTL
jgi:Rnl2 family RNA ligase